MSSNERDAVFCMSLFLQSCFTKLVYSFGPTQNVYEFGVLERVYTIGIECAVYRNAFQIAMAEQSIGKI